MSMVRGLPAQHPAAAFHDGARLCEKALGLRWIVGSARYRRPSPSPAERSHRPAPLPTPESAASTIP